ncbi:related to H+/oligopeptide symporter [Cephalotrichum gorgonifer]|uniref:Related to H+/oligopeptide symporter n=1 Tax=Cephalotrichum gorgonifer TaxID=2041049 RepID=A0AAE8N1F6_9PEZI|nr:related to H+/oligopeptide symporter [Cephalotrichum gorgonifer]
MNEVKERGGPIDPIAETVSEARDATNDEIKSLPHVIDRVPPAAWAAALIGAWERFSYYCIITIWQNYMQNKRGFHAVPGALGLGQSTATAISNGFFVFLFLTPTFFAIVSDTRLGRYRTLLSGLWFTNIASLSSIPATFLEREYDFWTAYLMASGSLLLAIVMLLIFRPKLVKIVPHENNLPKAFRVLGVAARYGFKLDHAKQSYQTHHHGTDVPWSDSFVDELKRGLIACRVIFSFAFFYLAITQMFNNLISQAGQMNLRRVPNDMIQAMSGVACVVFGPIIQALYNFLAKRRLSFGPMARITVAFLMCGGGMAYASGLQKLIYSTGPCYDAPRDCPASDGGRLPNDVNVWIQLPVYVALAIAEIFGLVTASEYAYSKAPKDMRSIVQAMVQLSACIGALMGMAISPAARDPYLVIVYGTVAGVMGLCSILFWWRFHKYDKIDQALNNSRDEESTSDGR